MNLETVRVDRMVLRVAAPPKGPGALIRSISWVHGPNR